MKRAMLMITGMSLGLCASFLKAEAPKVQEGPRMESIRSFIQRVKLGEGAVPVRLFAQGKKLTVNVVTPASPIRAHTHAKHEEVVYLVKGRGKMTLDGAVRDVKEGDIVYIPMGTVHGFTPGAGECQVLSIFAPAFDGKDRIFVVDQK